MLGSRGVFHSTSGTRPTSTRVPFYSLVVLVPRSTSWYPPAAAHAVGRGDRSGPSGGSEDEGLSLPPCCGSVHFLIWSC